MGLCDVLEPGPAPAMKNAPILAIVLIILGVQFLSMGFLGELIAKERGSELTPIRDRLEE